MRLISTHTTENIRIAWNAIGSQKLRTVITVSIIALGITSLVAMITATKALENKVNSEFSRLGSNTFSIRGGWSGGQQGEVEKKNKPVSYQQSASFIENFEFDAVVSTTAMGSFNAVVKYESNKTNPNVRIIGCDGSYIDLSGYVIGLGRNFSPGELEQGMNVVILGADILDEIFENIENPVGREVTIGGNKYEVIATLKSKGNSLGFSGDNQCFIPVANVRKNFATDDTEFTVNIRVNDVKKLDDAMDEAHGAMRVIRGNQLGEDDDFEMRKSDQFAKDLNELTSNITIGASIIGIITLLGAAIGLMNIMLVSVTERTKEIGTRKAVGASSKTIRAQFLIESIVIGQIGGAFGIVFGILMGNIVSYFVETSFTIPWAWIILGVTICFIVSVVSGYYPARKAAKLDPIEALRHE